MSIFNYLQLQPVEPSDDGTTSMLDTYEADETIDLNNDISENELDQEWANLINDYQNDPEKIVYSTD